MTRLNFWPVGRRVVVNSTAPESMQGRTGTIVGELDKHPRFTLTIVAFDGDETPNSVYDVSLLTPLTKEPLDMQAAQRYRDYVASHNARRRAKTEAIESILRKWESEDGTPLDLETARCLGGNWTPAQIESVWRELYA